MITAAAIKDVNGKVYTGRRHQKIEQNIPSDLLREAEDGFLTDTGEFVNREKAAKIAFECGQTKEDMEVLESTDLW